MIADLPSLRKDALSVRNSGPLSAGPLSLMMRWMLAWRQKRHLDRLPAELLRDMGMTEAERDALTVTEIAKGLRI